MKTEHMHEVTHDELLATEGGGPPGWLSWLNIFWDAGKAAGNAEIDSQLSTPYVTSNITFL